jgi:Leucine-rich repeat (LRR) protein
VGLEYLLLDSCGLTALPEGIGALTRLRVLYLGNNEELTALPAGLCALVGLEELHLDACGLTALPEGIGGLARLNKLDLNTNQRLAALPAGLGRLPNLEALYLDGCPRLAALYNLEELHQRVDDDERHERLAREGLPALLALLAAQGE